MMKLLFAFLAILFGKLTGIRHLISLLQIFTFDIPLTIKLCRVRMYVSDKPTLIGSIFLSIILHNLIWGAGLWLTVFLDEWTLYVSSSIVFALYVIIRGKLLQKHTLFSLYVQKHAHSLSQHFHMLIQGPYDNIQNTEEVLDIIKMYSKF